MKKGWIVLVSSVLMVFILAGSVFAFASDGNPIIRAGETHKGDFITGGNTVINDGIILGDFIAGAQMLKNSGEVEGDLIAGSAEINIDGHIMGSVRTGSNTVSISAVIDRNAMIFASNVVINEDAEIGRNAYLFGGIVSSYGRVSGDTIIYGGDVTLGGIYEGDVKINDMQEGSVFRMNPGTVIKGKLIYKGVTRYEVPSDVQVGEYEFIQIEPVSKGEIDNRISFWNIIKTIFTMLVYYLFALLLYKLFPRFFLRSGDFIEAKPLSAAGIGIATLGTLVAGSLSLVLLLILAIILVKGSVFFFGLLLFIFVMVVTVLFADIPVSIWLGNVITSRKYSVAGRLAIGIGSITILKIVLNLLKTISLVAPVIGVVSFILNVAIWVFGTGAIIKIIFETGKAANLQAEAEAESEEMIAETSSYTNDYIE
ncbi:MAG TPA: polymer-forming cytoskeletal protein [Clostridiaceae bacterium]|nr:polymer-forming cytoskeletal protein [Clostridiaceae bacterium]